MKKVLNDWPDRETEAILCRCAEAARPGGRVVVMGGVAADDARRSLEIDMVVEAGPKPSPSSASSRAGRAWRWSPPGRRHPVPSSSNATRQPDPRTFRRFAEEPLLLAAAIASARSTATPSADPPGDPVDGQADQQRGQGDEDGGLDALEGPEATAGLVFHPANDAVGRQERISQTPQRRTRTSHRTSDLRVRRPLRPLTWAPHSSAGSSARGGR